MWDNTVSYDATMADYWNSQLWAPDTVKNAMPANQLRGSIFTVSFRRTVAAGLEEDRAVLSFHMGVRPGTAGLYSHLDAADAQLVEDSFATKMFTAHLSTWMSTEWAIAEYIWRDFGADFPLDKNGVSKPGPIWRARVISAQGADSTSRLADQNAMTTTYKTASRKHWGRNYWGGFTTACLSFGTHGHFTATCVDSIAAGCRDWFQDLWDNPRVIEVIVWSAAKRGILGINELQVDDVVDVVRRRRAKQASYRKLYTS